MCRVYGILRDMGKRTKTLAPEVRRYLRDLASKGGKAKAEKLTDAERKKIGQKLAAARRRAARRKKASEKL